ncbi:MAG: hypothetical protein DWQ02_06120 [Bacteroidetes bacterium]|nr:MAG: hypothetical protein DWQ02_06120 [Bacteroidota bacterium]
MEKKTRTTLIFFIIVLVLFSGFISIAKNGIYQDGEWANAQWLGQDIVSVFLAVPLLFISYIQSYRIKNWKWQMVYTGALFYFVYTYAFFMFAAELTFLYLFHIPIFGLSLICLFWAFFDLFSNPEKITGSQKWAQRLIVSYLLLISLMLIIIWMTDIIQHLTDPLHQSDTPDGSAPLIIYSLDLAMAIPLMVIAAAGYAMDRQFGYKLTGVMLTKSTTLGFALMAMGLSMYIQKLNPDTFLIVLWCVLGIIGAVLTVWFLKQVKLQP